MAHSHHGIVTILLVVAQTSLGLHVDSRFNELVTRYGVHSRVMLATPLGKERGLFTTAAVKAGEPVLAVPFELCLVCRAEPGDIRSPWDAPHRDARDTLLARQLLQALFEGEAVTDERAGVLDQDLRDFWQAWSVMLPEVHTMSHPITLSAEARRDLHDAQLSHAAELQQRRVDAVLAGAPELPRSAGANAREMLEVEAAALRRWAVALCSSRPFSLPYELADLTENDDEELDGSAPPPPPPLPPQQQQQQQQQQLAAFVPFIDMANHDTDPNCFVQGRGDGVDASGSVGGVGGVGGLGLSAVGLVASRDLAAGEEVLISYFEGLPNAHVFSRFGFVEARPNRHDRILHLPSGLTPLSAAAVRQTTSACPGRWDAAGALFEAALLSLPLTRAPSGGAAAEVAAAEAVEAWLRQTAACEFATSLEQDEERQCEREQLRRDGQPGGGGAPSECRYGVEDALLAYRVQRKRLWATALDVLAAHREVHGVTVSTAGDI